MERIHKINVDTAKCDTEKGEASSIEHELIEGNGNFECKCGMCKYSEEEFRKLLEEGEFRVVIKPYE